MNIEQLIADLRSRVNPQYYDQVGTESYERNQCVMALESLMARIDVLREENERLAGCVNKLKVEHAWAIREAKRLTEENELLRGWIRVEGGCNNTCTRQILGEVCPSCRCGKAVKDAARSAKITQEPAP